MKLRDLADSILGRPLAVLACCYILGCVSYMMICAENTLLAVLCLLPGIILLALSINRWRQYRLLIIFMPLMLLAGYLRTAECGKVSQLKAYFDHTVSGTLMGKVCDIRYGSGGDIVVLNDTVFFDGEREYAGHKVRLMLDGEAPHELPVGCTVSAAGSFSPYLPATVPGEFDNESYYSVRGTDGAFFPSGELVLVNSDLAEAEGKHAQENSEPSRGNSEPSSSRSITGLAGDAYNKLNDILIRFRRALLTGLLKVLPRDDAGLIIAVLTGERGQMADTDRDLFSAGGIAHIFSISALHVTLLGMALYNLLMKFVGRIKPCTYTTIVLMVIYMILTGSSVSTARAVIMTAIRLLGKAYGRTFDGVSACGGAALVILLLRPWYITDMSFKLSFSAVLAVSCMPRAKAGAAILDKLETGITVWAACLPELLASYHFITPYSIILNLVVIPLMPVVIISGTLGALAGMLGTEAAVSGLSAAGTGVSSLSAVIFTLIGRYTAGVAGAIIALLRRLCELELKLPFGRLVLGCPAAWQKALCCLFVMIILFVASRTGKRLLLYFLLLCPLTLLPHAQDTLRIDFIDVGQGECISIRSPESFVIIDCGSTSVSDVGERRLIPFITACGEDHVDAVLTTHDDADHVNGLQALYSSDLISVGDVITGYVGDVMIGDIRLVQLSPEEDDRETAGPEDAQIGNRQSRNAGSLVLLLVYGDFSMLITGDSGEDEEVYYADKLTEFTDSVSVLDVAHHGSKSGTSSFLLNRAQPVVAVVSCGRDNIYGHPAAETLERLYEAGITVCRTDRDGTVSIVVYPDGMTVKRFLFPYI